MFSAEVAKGITDYVAALPLARWFFRDKVNSIPTAGSKESSYWFMGDRQQPKELNDYLHEIAPRIDGVGPDQAVINMYKPGDYMAEHIDVAAYRHNMVVNLSDNGDGIVIGGTLFPDILGRATILPAMSDPHSVPAVKHLRFVLIYLYE